MPLRSCTFDAALWWLIVTMVGINWAGLGSFTSHCFKAWTESRSQDDLDGLHHSCRVSSVSRRCQNDQGKESESSRESFSQMCNASSLPNLSHPRPNDRTGPEIIGHFLESFNAKISSLKSIFKCSKLALLMSFDPTLDYDSVSSRHSI